MQMHSPQSKVQSGNGSIIFYEVWTYLFIPILQKHILTKKY